MGHTTFVLAKNILTWTDCTENKRSRLCPNLILSKNGCSHLYFVESRGAWVQPWAYLGRGLRIQSPQMNFCIIPKLKIYKNNNIQCHVMSKPKPPPKAKTPPFYGYAPGLTLMLMP